ncbi:hypothetical protein [Yersinia enterocolitica]|uniref:hypothetical protein n=1 Tax=Yersinia enterocolitica TaxID=630 RepID=UPI0009F3DFDB|nr:hypothetical protein [Yersinia enterocolitica]PNM20054.1 hypothetical protein A6J65_015125 [Yersinia enterocolitica]HDL7732307.1 hypothetical protein [Yersinia enterocolitica]
MTTKQKVTNEEKNSEESVVERPTCFVIMPIADSQGYESNHFNRVYKHLIAPACTQAGFEPIRADEVSSSNMIVVDILKKIVESDLAICDLSSRNPNVLYELGLRQAFNKKTVLIKDNLTISPFDVSAFRYSEYNSTLRIDHVQNEVSNLAKAIRSTVDSENDINSIVQLLQIEPAKIGDKTELSTSDTIIIKMINDLSAKINGDTSINQSDNASLSIDLNDMNVKLPRKIIFSDAVSTNMINYCNYYEFYYGNKRIGKVFNYDPTSPSIVFRHKNGTKSTFVNDKETTEGIYGLLSIDI